MNSSTQAQQISLADQLLQQLEDQYLAVHAQNITVPKQNLQPQEDPQNPYQPLDFDDEDEDINDQQQQHEYKNTRQQQQQQKPEQSMESFQKQIQTLRLSQGHANHQVKELIEVPPVDDSIYAEIPQKDFHIDEEKIKSFALSMQINSPDWLQDQSLCKLRIEQLFTKNVKNKPFTKI